MPTKRAILDVDNTLWDLMAPVHELLDMLHGPFKWGVVDQWNHHRDFVTDEQFYSAVASCHASQITYSAFRGAALLFDSLDKTGWEVVVASVRAPQRAASLIEWLDHCGLGPYTGVYSGADKHFLIRTGDLVIDDNPETIIYAGRAGAQAISLIYPYNREALRKPSIGTPAPKGFYALEAMALWVRQNQ